MKIESLNRVWIFSKIIQPQWIDEIVFLIQGRVVCTFEEYDFVALQIINMFIQNDIVTAVTYIKKKHLIICLCGKSAGNRNIYICVKINRQGYDILPV